MTDTFTFTLDEETEKRLFELLTDVDVSKTPSFSIKDKYGNTAEYVKVVRCKDCVYSEDTYHDGDCYCNRPKESLQYICNWGHYCGWALRKDED